MISRALATLRRSIILARSQAGNFKTDDGGQIFYNGVRFDVDFYRARYKDLSGLSNRALFRHYVLFGRDEGRVSNDDIHVVADLPGFREAGLLLDHLVDRLPRGFSAKHYLHLNPDLSQAGLSQVEAAQHYALQGAEERRQYLPFNTAVYRELYFPGQQVSDDCLKAHFFDRGCHLGLIGSAAEYLARKGHFNGYWADLLNVEEFSLLNWGWAGPVRSYLAAVDLMIEEGISRLAPLNLSLNFDPKYYREAHPSCRALNDADLYRRWLEVDKASTPGSAAEHLRRLGLSLSAFPESFAWMRYTSTDSPKFDSKWDALDHLIENGFSKNNLPPIIGGCEFWLELGKTFSTRNDNTAVACFGYAEQGGALEPTARQWLADCHFRLGDWKHALDNYRVASSAKPNVWTFVNGARSALYQDDILGAFEMLRLGREISRGEEIWSAVVREVVQAQFSENWRRARRPYLAGDRALGDQILTRAVVDAEEQWSRLDPPGTPVPAHPDGRVVVLANTDIRQCTHYRVEQKRYIFESLGRPYEIFSESQYQDFISALPGAAVAIFYRLAAVPDNIRAIATARALGIPTYYDIDDLIFEADFYPEPLSTYSGVSEEAYLGLQEGVPLFRAAMSLCDFGIASTDGLAEIMKPIVRSGTVYVLPNGLDPRNESFLDRVPERIRRDDEFVIFYGSGTRAHNSDFLSVVGPALRQVMEQHRHVRLAIAGFLDLDQSFDGLNDRITILDWTPDVASYWALLAQADLNIAVLAPGVIADLKSEIKWLEAAVLAVPSIVSATRLYRDVLIDGYDVMIAEDANAWVEKLESAISNPRLRGELVSNARLNLRKNYTLRRNTERMAQILPSITLNANTAKKTRIMIVNVFFPPQTVGGATRVVRDNVDYLLGNAANEVDLAIFTSDLDATTPYRLRIDSYKGIPVYRVSTPIEVNMDWRPQNPEIKLIFSDVIEAWRPDLIHFHCVQRLSAAVIEACREAGVPYVVTAHDAFWLSDYQFLTDQRHRLRPPNETWPLDPPPPVSVGASLLRRRYLASLLNGAARTLSVSHSFTRLYQAAGFPQTQCVANGVSAMARPQRKRSRNGKVRLAHIGSQTYFKGYHHVQAALKQSMFSNLELTVVDHSRVGGSPTTDVWGSTEVTFVGKAEQDQMQQFYADKDVLLAPSVWPESFGLVSREAAAAGLWVVASDRGAIGEDITPDVDGWIIDVTTPEGLINVLGMINANPAAYLESPPAPDSPLRTADDQARELLQIYRAVLGGTRPQPTRTQPPGARAFKAEWSLRALRSKATERDQKDI